MTHGETMKKYLLTALVALYLATGIGDAAAQAPREIDWLELMPPEDLAALQAMGEIDHGGMGENAPAPPPNDAMTSTKTVPTMNGARGKIPGYVVPVAFDDKGRITELFLVPYFGACIHMPPPPPNQIIHIKPKSPLPAGNIWDAYWAVGTVRIAMTENDMALSAYSMDLDRLEVIEE
jgi:hypothetical protein